MNWYLKVLKNYVGFSGRASRSEYWYFQLFNSIILIALIVVDFMLGSYSLDAGLGMLSGIYGLAVFLPSLAVGFRRLHDTGHTAWWILISLVPIVGAIVLLIFLVTKSDEGDNDYGPPPLPA